MKWVMNGPFNHVLQNPPRIEIIQKLVALGTIAVINAAV